MPHRDTHKGNHEQQPTNDRRGAAGKADQQEPGGASQPAASGHKRQPLQLLALDRPGPTSTHKRRQGAGDRPDKQREEGQDVGDNADRVDGRIVKGGNPGWVIDLDHTQVERARLQHHPDGDAGNGHPQQPRHHPPTGGWHPAVGEQQQQQGQGRQVQQKGPGGQPGHPGGRRQRAGSSHQGPHRILERERLDGSDQAHADKQPADGMVRSAYGQHQPDHGKPRNQE
jgi:hypothetical protein